MMRHHPGVMSENHKRCSNIEFPYMYVFKALLNRRSKAKPLQIGGFRECEEYVQIVHEI